MTDERTDNAATDPDEQDGSAEQPAGVPDDSSEMDDLLEAINTAAADADDAAAVPRAETSSAAEPKDEAPPAEAPEEAAETREVTPSGEGDEAVAEAQETVSTPEMGAASEEAPVDGGTGPDAGADVPSPAASDAGSQDSAVDTVSEAERPEAVEPAGETAEQAEIVEALPEDAVAGVVEPVGEDVERAGIAEETAVAVAQTDAAGAEVEGEPVVGEEVGTAVEPVPLAVAEALAETQHRRRRRMVYVLVPALAVGLAAALTQVRLGGTTGKPPAVRDWERGMELVESGELAQGLETLENVVATTPLGMKRTFAHARLAEVYAGLAQKQPHYLNGAIRHYCAVLDEVNAGRVDASALPVDEVLYRTGRCFVALGSDKTAIEYFEQIDREHPGSPLRAQAQLEMAESLIGAGEYQRARRVLAELAETHRNEPLGERAFFRFAQSFDEEAESLEGEP